MFHGKRKQLPTSDPEYILSLLEGDSSGELDSDLYSASDDEDSFFSEASPTSSFQSYSSICQSPSISSGHRNLSIPSVSPPTSSFQSYHTRASPAKSSLQASSTTVQASSQSLQALSSLFILLNESLTLLFLLNFTPTPLPSLVLLLPLHYNTRTLDGVTHRTINSTTLSSTLTLSTASSSTLTSATAMSSTLTSTSVAAAPPTTVATTSSNTTIFK